MLKLATLVTHGGEPLFNGRMIHPGVHVRWSYTKELGPANYFSVFRSDAQVVVGNTWAGVELVRLAMPVVERDVWDRVRPDLEAGAASDRDLYHRSATQLVDLVRTTLRTIPPDVPLHEVEVPVPPTAASHGRVRVIDALLLSSLDPYIARMQGLYWIDQTALKSAPGSRFYYKVIGDYGTREWAPQYIDFTRVKPSHVRPVMRFGDVELAMRTFAVPIDDDIFGPHLRASGDAALPLELLFPKPMQEIKLRVRVGRGEWGAVVDFRPATVTEDADQLTIRAADGTTFRQVWLFGPAEAWHLFQLWYWEQRGPIGRVETEWVPVAIPASSTRAPRPSPCKITRLAAESIPATLDASGEVPLSSSQVAVSAQSAAAPDDPYRPVRLRIRRDAQAEPAISVLQAPLPEPVLPELVAFWPLEGHARDLKSAGDGTVVGTHAYVVENVGDARRPALRIARGAFVNASTDRRIQHVGDQLTLQVRVKPDAGQSMCTLIGNDWQQSYWLGLRGRSDGMFVPRFWLNRPATGASAALEGSRGIAPGRWSQLTVNYDGAVVRFYVDGELDTTRPLVAGVIRVNPRGQLILGADSGSTSTAPQYPFAGALADVRIWQQALAPAEADDQLALYQNALANRTSLADLVYAIPGITELAADSQLLESRQAALQSLGEQLTLELWLKPTAAQDSPTLVGNNAAQSFWLGLARRSDGAYVPQLKLRRAATAATSVFAAHSAFLPNRWSHLAVTYDGAYVRFYKDGARDIEYRAVLGPVTPNPARTLIIGADSGSTAIHRVLPFIGSMADVRIWQAALEPAALQDRVGGVQRIDRPVPDGEHTYVVEAIDVFGRLSAASTPATIGVTDELPPSPPVDLRADLAPPIGRIVALDGSSIIIESASLAGALEAGALRAPDELIGCDVLVVRSAGDGSEGASRQTFEISAISAMSKTPSRYRVNLEGPPFTQLDPAPGDRIVVQVDLELRLAWAWTGLQRLFYPRAREFRLHIDRGPLGALRGRIAEVETVEGDGRYRVVTDLRYDGPAGALREGRCQLGGSLYRIVEHTTGAGLVLDVEYRARPVIPPRPDDLVTLTLSALARQGRDYRLAEHWTGRRLIEPIRVEDPWRAPDDDTSYSAIPLADGAYDAFVARGVNWLPRGQVYRLHTDRLRVPADYVDPDPQSFVPGALVAIDDGSTTPGHWQAFNIVWHQREDDGLAVYLQFHDPEHDRAIPLPARTLRRPRYLPGQRYGTRDFVASEFLPGEGTIEWVVGPTTADNQRSHADHRGEADRFGNESAIGQTATTVAVDRRRPETPTAPVIVSIEKADYYGRSRVSVVWDEEPGHREGTRYQLYRALDSAVFSRDLEQRRLATGYYKALERRSIVGDDTNFEAWIACFAHRHARPGLVTNWQTALFAPRPARPRNADDRDLTAQWAAWDSATPVWRDWADRFYPMLSDAQLVDIAGRSGNESAFALVHERPLTSREHADQVDGRTSDRYLYRLRTSSASLLGSTLWGAPSTPMRPPIVKAPTAPVISRLDAGDQNVIIRWSLNREPDLLEYRLYRAMIRSALEDLRFWGARYEDDERWVATIPDPRIRVRDRAVVLAGVSHLVEVLGVYRASDFDFQALPPTAQPGALDYFEAATTQHRVGADTLAIERLRPIADGTSVVVVYRDDAGQEQVLAQTGEASYRDDGLVGLEDYFYRLVAVRLDDAAAPLVSAGSAIVKARPLGLTKPTVPAFRQERTEISPGLDEVALWTEDRPSWVDVLIKRREPGSALWRTVVDWTPLETGRRYTDRIATSQASAYSVFVRTRRGLLCDEPRLVFSQARAAE